MKNTLTILAIVLALLAIGCTGEEESENAPVGTSPQIDQVRIYEDYAAGELLPSTEIDPGDELVLSLTMTDPDLDVRRVFVEFYSAADNYETLQKTLDMAVEDQDAASFTYDFVDDPYVVQPSYGFWKIIFYAVDAGGNESDEYQLILRVK